MAMPDGTCALGQRDPVDFLVAIPIEQAKLDTLGVLRIKRKVCPAWIRGCAKP